jgi:hypothetical protein
MVALLQRQHINCVTVATWISLGGTTLLFLKQLSSKQDARTSSRALGKTVDWRLGWVWSIISINQEGRQDAWGADSKGKHFRKCCWLQRPQGSWPWTITTPLHHSHRQSCQNYYNTYCWLERDVWTNRSTGTSRGTTSRIMTILYSYTEFDKDEEARYIFGSPSPESWTKQSRKKAYNQV